MRGDDPNAAHMFSYVSPEQRVPADHPLRPIRRIDRRGAGRSVAAVRADVLRYRPAVGAAGEAVAGVAAAGALHDSERTAADGATGLQHVVSLVRRPEYGRCGLVRRRRSARIGTGCWRATWRQAFFDRGACGTPMRRACCRPSTSAWMARCSRRRRVRKASGRSDRTRRPRTTIGESEREFSRAATDESTPISRPPIPTARLYQESRRAAPRDSPTCGHVLMENRSWADGKVRP